LPEPANIARRAMFRRLITAHHLSEEVDIIIALARHLLANGMQFFQKSRTLIHNSVFSFQFSVFSWASSIDNLKLKTENYLLKLTHQKLGRHDLRDEESGGGVEELDPRLPMDIREIAEIPGHQKIDLVE
jgi:hypothetical protein